MPKTINSPRINPIRKAILKNKLIQGNTAKDSLLQAGYSKTYAHRSTDAVCVKVCQAEIMTEAKKRGIINKAWKVCENELDNPKHRANLAQALATKDMTDKQQISANVTNKSEALLTKHRLTGLIA